MQYIVKVFIRYLDKKLGTSRLDIRYKKLNSRISALSFTIGFPLLLAYMYFSRELMGIPQAGGSFNEYPLFYLWLFLVILAPLITFYIGWVLSAGTFSVYMYSKSIFNSNEAISYTFKSRYPGFWYANS